MLYDVVRILGLRIIADLNQSLIKLSMAPGDAQFKKEIVIHLQSLCYNQMLIKDNNDAHSVANKNHLSATAK